MSRDDDDVDTAFRWERKSGIGRIFEKSEFLTAARSINDDSVIVGMCRPKSDKSLYADDMRLFATEIHGKMPIVSKPKNYSCEAWKINTGGAILGTCRKQQRLMPVFNAKNGDASLLSGQNGGDVFAVDLNDNDVVLGYEQAIDRSRSAFVWSYVSGYTTVPISETAIPSAVNNHGTIVFNEDRDGVRRSFIRRDGEVKRLAYFSYHASHVMDINDENWAVGQMSSDYHCHAVLWEVM